MSQGGAELVFRHARGLGEGMIKAATAVNELLVVADRDRDVIAAALERARSEAGAETQNVGEDTQQNSDAPSAEAPALLAVHLLEQALEQLDGS